MDDHSISINSEPCISKVHVGLRNVKPEAYERNVKPEAYEPMLVSIGPYHKANPHLQAMQQKKKLYLNSLLERRNESPESPPDYYLSELARLETKARKCYADPMSTINDKEFTEMMLLDSCFVVEFIRKMNSVPSDENDPMPDFDKNDPIGKVQWMQNQIQLDMLLLENQLPYFVLSKFYDMTKYDGEKSLEQMAMSCFNASLPRPRLHFSNRNGEEINHLLHLVHIFCRPSAQRHGKSHNFNDNSDQNCSLLEKNPKDIPGSVNREGYELKNHIGTVVELQEAGVNFEKVGKVYDGGLIEGTRNDYVSLFDIEFKRGVMKVPSFKVDASTETLLRNLIAYEQQYFKDVEPKYFTDFAMLMNQLINSEKDTTVLRYKDIIINFLPDDKDVSQLFNTLIVGVCDSYESYFLEELQKVDKHCKIPCKKGLAFLKRNCFKDPCVGTSTVAAIILLLLTVAQLIVALRN